MLLLQLLGGPREDQKELTAPVQHNDFQCEALLGKVAEYAIYGSHVLCHRVG